MAELNSQDSDLPQGNVVRLETVKPLPLQTKITSWSDVIVGTASSLTAVFLSAGMEGAQAKQIGFLLAGAVLVFALVSLKLRGVGQRRLGMRVAIAAALGLSLIAAVVVAVRSNWLAEATVEVGWREFDHADLEEVLSARRHRPGAQNEGPPLSYSVVQTDSDRQRDDANRLGGWQSWLEIAERAQKDEPAERDQAYTFLSLRNTGNVRIDALRIAVSDSEPIAVRNLACERTVLVPVEIRGRYANLSRTRDRVVRSIAIDSGRWYAAPKDVRVPDRSASKLPDRQFGGLYGYPDLAAPAGAAANPGK
jgi:hypothetical protein